MQRTKTFPLFTFRNAHLIVHKQMCHIVEPINFQVVPISHRPHRISQRVYPLLQRPIIPFQPEKVNIVRAARGVCY